MAPNRIGAGPVAIVGPMALGDRLRRLDERMLGDRRIEAQAPAPTRRRLALAVVLALAAVVFDFTPWAAAHPWTFAVNLVLVGPLAGIQMNTWLRRSRAR